MDKYINAIKQEICSICADSDENGNCTLNEKESCAVELFVEEIVEVIQSTESEYIEDYREKLKDKVCTNCKAKDSTGKCYLKEDANCSLDRYFNIIVETIKKVD